MALVVFWIYGKSPGQHHLHEEWSPYVRAKCTEIHLHVGQTVCQVPDRFNSARCWAKACAPAAQHVIGIALCRASSLTTDLCTILSRDSTAVADYWAARYNKIYPLMFFEILDAKLFAQPVRVHSDNVNILPKGICFNVSNRSLRQPLLPVCK